MSYFLLAIVFVPLYLINLLSHIRYTFVKRLTTSSCLGGPKEKIPRAGPVTYLLQGDNAELMGWGWA